MGNSFSITLASKNWNPDVAAWELAVLRLPGAQIHDVFHLGNRLDPAWYAPIPEQGLLRWVRGSDAPPEITVLMQAPSPSRDELPPRWKKAGIVLPVVGAVIVAIIAVIPAYLAHRAAPKEPARSTETKPPAKPAGGQTADSGKEAPSGVRNRAKDRKAVAAGKNSEHVETAQVRANPSPAPPDVDVQNPAVPHPASTNPGSPTPNLLAYTGANTALPPVAGPSTSPAPQPSSPDASPLLAKAVVMVGGPASAPSARIVRILVEKAESSEARDVLDSVSTKCLSGSPFRLAADGQADARLRYAGSPQPNQVMFLFESVDGARSQPYYAYRENVGRSWKVEPLQAAEDICTDFLPRRVDLILNGK
jgi:hypothetical protein